MEKKKKEKEKISLENIIIKILARLFYLRYKLLSLNNESVKLDAKLSRC